MKKAFQIAFLSALTAGFLGAFFAQFVKLNPFFYGFITATVAFLISFFSYRWSESKKAIETWYYSLPKINIKITKSNFKITKKEVMLVKTNLYKYFSITALLAFDIPLSTIMFILNCNIGFSLFILLIVSYVPNSPIALILLIIIEAIFGFVGLIRSINGVLDIENGLKSFTMQNGSVNWKKYMKELQYNALNYIINGLRILLKCILELVNLVASIGKLEIEKRLLISISSAVGTIIGSILFYTDVLLFVNPMIKIIANPFIGAGIGGFMAAYLVKYQKNINTIAQNISIWFEYLLHDLKKEIDWEYKKFELDTKMC